MAARAGWQCIQKSQEELREYMDTLGDPSNILDLIRKIGYRQGEGDLLARGTRAAAEVLGVDLAMQVKGLELAAYDPRKLTGMAISYSTANRGGCHSRAWTVADEVSGREFSGAELMLNVRRGVDAAQDSLPRRLLDGLLFPEKYHDGMATYYRLRDWDANGQPRRASLESMGLDFLAKAQKREQSC
jgi:aldehyde:ferredoxin oxidoreductase